MGCSKVSVANRTLLIPENTILTAVGMRCTCRRVDCRGTCCILRSLSYQQKKFLQRVFFLQKVLAGSVVLEQGRSHFIVTLTLRDGPVLLLSHFVTAQDDGGSQQRLFGVFNWPAINFIIFLFKETHERAANFADVVAIHLAHLGNDQGGLVQTL